jgi:hypothetical protein
VCSSSEIPRTDGVFFVRDTEGRRCVLQHFLFPHVSQGMASVVQAVSRRLPTSEALVRARVK